LEKIDETDTNAMIEVLEISVPKVTTIKKDDGTEVEVSSSTEEVREV
jgi:hypothetical protein